MKAVELENIIKTYPTKKTSVTAVDDVSFSVEEGELFGLIGPDGAARHQSLEFLQHFYSLIKGVQRFLAMML